VIRNRAHPAKPLAPLSARGELVEIRAADLRFTGEEATAYLNDVNALGLRTADVAALESRTEGWVAALQLAALSLLGHSDPAQFISGFAGDDRFVVDYLGDEVLDRQPSEVRRFLLDTCVLGRLTGSLCDAVTGRSDGKAMLTSLERQNLFVVPLDERRRWYRYHHLFADVLRAHLLDERPGDLPELHRRAGDWYDRAGQVEAAVRHALAAGDVGTAADRVEIAIPGLRRERREAVIRRWVDELPTEVVRRRPVLAVGLVGALMASNEFDGVEQRLGDVERLLAARGDDTVIADHDELARLPAQVETYRAALALVGGDLSGAVRRAAKALGQASADDRITPASASAILGLASWAGGDLDVAHRAYSAAADGLERTGHLADVLGCTITLADIELTQGRLGDAERSFQRALALIPRGSSPLRGTADMYVGLSRVAWERGDLAGAADHLRRAEQLGDQAGLPQNPYRWRVALAQLRQAEGDVATALGLLEDAERVYVGDFNPDVRPVAATRARMMAAAGDLDGARTWVHRRGVSATDEPAYLREYEHITLARILLADHAASGSATSLSQAAGLLDRLLTAAEAGGRTGTTIEVMTLRVLAHEARGAHHEALSSLDRALTLAEPEGYTRIFIDEGKPMIELLKRLSGASRDPSFVQRLLAAMTDPTTAATGSPTGGRADARAGSPPQATLVDPLSHRELDVLRLLATELDGPAIARHLGVSLTTVRTHTQHIYTKLGVANRRSAVHRAHQLNLFSRPALA